MMQLPIMLQTRGDLDEVLIQAVQMNASDVHFSSDLRLSVRQQGVIQPVSQRVISMTELSNLLVAAQDENTSVLSIVNSGEDLDFAYVCKTPLNEACCRFRVNASGKQFGGKNGLSMVFRVINPHPPCVEDLGVEVDIVDCMIHLTQGLAIVAGPTGSGKSTLLAAINRKRLETRSEVMITHEAPIEFVYDEVVTDSVVNQREVGHSGHYKTFYDALVGALRQDPDLILVGEARDRETLNAVMQGVQTGHALFTTVHTQGVAHTLNRMVKEFEAHEREAKLMDMIDSLAIIIYQNLVPSTDGQRVALREYLIFDGEVKDRLRESPIKQLFANTMAALMDKGQTLLMDAKQKWDAGRIDQKTYRRLEKHAEAEMSKITVRKTQKEP